MEEELKYAPMSFHNQMMAKIRTYRRELAMFQRKMKSTDLGVVPGGHGDPKFGIYATENEQSVSTRYKLTILILFICIGDKALMVLTKFNSFQYVQRSCDCIYCNNTSLWKNTQVLQKA